jgi:hypothetical protein
MDPYLERFWNDVHGKLIAYIGDELNASLPPRYRASLQERVIIADLDLPLSGARYPDVAVLDWPSDRQGGVATAGRSQRLLVRSPELVAYAGEPLKQYSVEIIDGKFGEKVVTAIEVLSPENKRPGDGMVHFKRKQDEYRSARVNRVEIDLLREGRRMFEFPQRFLLDHQLKPYYVTVHRGHRAFEAELYAIDLRDRLPAVNIPLREREDDVPLELQPLLNKVYANGRFPIDYDEACDPPLDGEDATWARELIRAKGKQPS